MSRQSIKSEMVIDRDSGRRADLAAIHMAKAALQWDDATYRDILFTVCRVRSSAGLDFTGRKCFLAHLRACGWRPGTSANSRSRGHASAADKPRNPWTKQHGLLWSLWQQLADGGLVHSRHRAALNAWVTRQTGVDRLEWLNSQQLNLALISLKAWLDRREPAE